MKVNSLFKSLITIAFIAAASQAQAAREGVSYYYGLGLGAMQVDEPQGGLGLDAAGYGSLFFGLEEDGWAIEYTGFQTLETGTDNQTLEYKVTGSIVSLGYRTIEDNGNYYKFSYGSADADIDLITSTATTTGSFDGSVYTFGWGMRLQSKNRLEFDYSYFDASGDETNSASKIHMITARYLFGGSAPSGNR